MIAEGTEAKAVEESQIQAVAADVEVFRRAHRLSAKSIAKAVGYGHSTITEFLGGKYAGNRAEVAINLDAWLVDEEARRSRPETTQFVWTNVAQQIEGAAGYCREHRSIGLVYGPLTSGLGKTTALRAIYERMGARACSLVTIDKVDASPTGLLRKILSAMHVAENGSNKNRFDRIVEKLRGRAHLLLIDQIHNLRYSKEDRPFYILTDLHAIVVRDQRCRFVPGAAENPQRRREPGPGAASHFPLRGPDRFPGR
jgi:DNA transposition AAA+ family ATPase